jgi:hypothetical protein
MIRIGLSDAEKRDIVQRYIQNHGITNVYAFSWESFHVSFDVDVPIEYYGYKDIIEYKPFYHLLEVIDERSLLVFNECMRTQNRSDLTYNCAHHYCNQTPHKIVFETFPFIEDKDDFMILLDFLDKGKYKGKSFDWSFLHDEDVRAKPRRIIAESIDVGHTAKALQEYEKKKVQLLDGLGNSDPDTIPRNLHVFVGRYKAAHILPGLEYVARNDRFKLPNVTTYKHVERRDYIVIDFPHRRLDFNDFLKTTGMRRVQFLNTGLKVDQHYFRELQHWIGRLEEFYAKASLCE